MLSLFVVAVATAVLTYSFLYRHLERRDTAQAVRRLAARAAEKEKTGRRPSASHRGRRGCARLADWTASGWSAAS